MNFFHAVNATSVPPASIPIVTGNLQLHYDFTDPACYGGTGNVVQDLTSNNRDLTFVNAPTWKGTYFNFDGVNDYGFVSGYNNAPLTGTFSFWFRPNQSYVNTQVNMRLAGWNSDWEMVRGGGPTLNCGYTKSAGQIVFDLGGPNYLASNNSVWLSNTWYHVTITWSRTGGTSAFYLNGVFDRTGCPPGSATNVGSGMSIGRSPGNLNEYWDADLGWLAVYNDILTSAEILQNFNATKSSYGY